MIDYTDEQLVYFINKLQDNMQKSLSIIKEMVNAAPDSFEFYKTRTILEENKVLKHSFLLYFTNKSNDFISDPTVLLNDAWGEHDVTESECYPKPLNSRMLRLIEEGEKILNSYAERMESITTLDINKL